jgi:DNA polymerase II small subunit
MELTEAQKRKVKELYDAGVLVTPTVLEKIRQGKETNTISNPKKKNYSPADFAAMYNHRFKTLSELIRKKNALANLTSISHASAKKKDEQLSIIGLIREKRETRSGHTQLILEDPTGEIRVLLHKDKERLKTNASWLVVDGCIGIQGRKGDGILFADNIIMPGSPDSQIRMGKEEKQLIFIGDIHYGNKLFQKESFERFLAWLASEKDIAALIITGDLVEGVGCYPGQEEDLLIKDIRKQYKDIAAYLTGLPDSLPIYIIPGNHDAVRLAEPQPPIPEEFAQSLYERPNIHLLASPATIDIGGLHILLYHGMSFPYYATTIESIRIRGGMQCADLIMELLLRNRHLAPTAKSAQVLPIEGKDALLIERKPDIFATGHMHTTLQQQCGPTTCLNCSTWVTQSDYQRKHGIIPDPCKVFSIDMKTRKIKIEDFS